MRQNFKKHPNFNKNDDVRESPGVLFFRMFCKENIISDLFHVTVTKMSFKMIGPRKGPQGQIQ